MSAEAEMLKDTVVEVVKRVMASAVGPVVDAVWAVVQSGGSPEAARRSGLVAAGHALVGEGLGLRVIEEKAGIEPLVYERVKNKLLHGVGTKPVVTDCGESPVHSFRTAESAKKKASVHLLPPAPSYSDGHRDKTKACVRCKVVKGVTGFRAGEKVCRLCEKDERMGKAPRKRDVSDGRVKTLAETAGKKS